MENAEEIQLVLERYSRLKPKEIPEALEEYMSFVAKTGDTVFKWPLIQHLFREKLMNVITEFHDSSPSITDLPHYPNVDPFNFDLMKKNLVERMESFNAAPFTIQRICELLTEPRKQYSRLDKFMRAIEKNILVVSTTEPGRTRHESENGESLDSTVNGDLMSEGQLDVGSSEEDQTTLESTTTTTTSDKDAANGAPEQAETQPIDTLTAIDNPDIDVPLEKLEPEVNVLTIEPNEPFLKSTNDDLQAKKTTTENVTETTESVLEDKVSDEVTPETDTTDTSNVTEETKVEEETPPEASPSKRVMEVADNEILIDENASKKLKLDTDAAVDEAPQTNTEIIPTDDTPIDSIATENLVPDAIDEVPESIPVAIMPITETTDTEVLPSSTDDNTATSLLIATDTTAVVTPILTTTTEEIPEEEIPIQPLPPIETIVQETTMEEQQQQQVNIMTNSEATGVPVVEDEDSMKVDTTPLLITPENKMQTDDVDETAASAMDVDECSTDFME